MYTEYKTPDKSYLLKTDKFVCNKFGLAEFFAQHYYEFETGHEMRVLDAGCGVMPIGIFLADQFQCSVVGIDLNPEACRCAKDNIDDMNMDDKCEAINADFEDFVHMYEGEKFDLIVANPPVDDSVSNDDITQYVGSSYECLDDSAYSFLTNSWHSAEGKDLADYIFEFGNNNLSLNGRIILVFCMIDCSSPEYIYKKARSNGYKIVKIANGSIAAESIGAESMGVDEIDALMVEFRRQL